MESTRWTVPGEGVSVAALLEALQVNVGGYTDLVHEAFSAEVESERTALEVIQSGGGWDWTDTTRVRAEVARLVAEREQARERRESSFRVCVIHARSARLANARRG
jgi:hypothetical protein